MRYTIFMENVMNIKALSINECFQGRRFRTAKYLLYSRKIIDELPDSSEIPEGKLEAYYVFGVSNSASDTDNMVKPLQDLLQKKYGFNDKQIYRFTAQKIIVKKGNEFIGWDIHAMPETDKPAFATD